MEPGVAPASALATLLGPTAALARAWLREPNAKQAMAPWDRQGIPGDVKTKMVVEWDFMEENHRKMVVEWDFMEENSRKMVVEWDFMEENPRKMVVEWDFMEENHRKMVVE